MVPSGRQEISLNTSSTTVLIIIKSIQRTGLWSVDNGYKVTLAKLFATCFILANVTQVISLAIARDNPEKMFECFSVLSFCGIGVLKYVSLYRNSAAWQYILSRTSELESEQINKKNDSLLEYETEDENNDIVSNKDIYENKSKFVSTLLTRIYTFTGIIFVVSPFIEFLLKNFKDMKHLNLPHILPGWSPLDDLHISGYIFTIICEVIAAAYCVSVHVAFDVIYVGLMIFSCGQFNYLWKKSERIGGSGKVCGLSRKRDERAHYRIKQCHKSHVVLVDILTKMNNLLRIILTVYFTVATLTLCTVAVRLKSEKLGVMQIMSLLQYMAANLMQLFLYCRYGDELLNQSSINMGKGPFGASWWSLSPSTRRHLSLLAVGMSRRHHLSAGIYIVNLPSFVQIVKTAYSYYAVLR
nr:odorant receptor 2 [Achelura yunnanensis]